MGLNPPTIGVGSARSLAGCSASKCIPNISPTNSIYLGLLRLQSKFVSLHVTTHVTMYVCARVCLCVCVYTQLVSVPVRWENTISPKAEKTRLKK